MALKSRLLIHALIWKQSALKHLRVCSLNSTRTFSPHLPVHNSWVCGKQKQLEIFYSDSGSNWSSAKFFDLSTTKITRYTKDDSSTSSLSPKNRRLRAQITALSKWDYHHYGLSVHYLTNKWHALKGKGKGWTKVTFERYLPVQRTCNHPLCTHRRTWIDERGVSDSRYVIEKGKSTVIIGLFQWLAAACLGGNMPTLTSASVWLVGGQCPGQCRCVLVPSHPCCFWNRTANIDRSTPILRLSPAVALSTVLLHPRDIWLVTCQSARQAVCRTIGSSFHFQMIDGSPPKACQ